jgi:hypothetical protein
MGGIRTRTSTNPRTLTQGVRGHGARLPKYGVLFCNSRANF